MRIITCKSEFLLRRVRNHRATFLLLAGHLFFPSFEFSLGEVFHPDCLSLEGGGLSGCLLGIQRTGAAQTPNTESVICNVTVNSEIGPKSCACSQSHNYGGEFPQPAPTCGKVSNSHTSTGRHQCCCLL